MQCDPPAAHGLSAPPGAVGMTHISSSLSGFYSFFFPFFSLFHTTNWLDLQQRDLWWALVLKSSDLGHDSFVQSACSTCWFDCHFQFSHDPAVLEWGISGRKWDWKLVLLVWQLHSSESNAKHSSYLYSDLMLKQGIHCICLMLRQEVRKSSAVWFLFIFSKKKADYFPYFHDAARD